MLGYPVKVNVLDVLRNVNLQSRLHNCIYAMNGQMKGWNYTNFESNLAVMVMCLPVKFEFDWTKHFELESGNRIVDKQMDKQTNRITPI